MKFDYCLYNPSGNITALVTSFVPSEKHIDVADAIMKNEPTCEQVGFIAQSEDADIAVEMAGGEFCGNATLCTAALYARTHAVTGMDNRYTVRCSGCDSPLKVKIVPYNGDMGIGVVTMPKPYDIDEFKGYKLVRFKGIDHLIVPNETEAGDDIKAWAEELNAEALGIMFYNSAEGTMKPLVYVRNSDTLFWENSCASGSSAVAYVEGDGARLYLEQPGGVIKVENKGGEVLMTNKVSLVKQDSIEI